MDLETRPRKDLIRAVPPLAPIGGGQPREAKLVQPEAGGTERLWVIFTQVYFYSGFVKLWGSIPTYIVHTLAYLKRYISSTHLTSETQ